MKAVRTELPHSPFLSEEVAMRLRPVLLLALAVLLLDATWTRFAASAEPWLWLLSGDR
jgi:hypothetical protein